MEAEETHRIADALHEIAEKLTPQQYTITGAADWEILLVAGGLGVVMVGVMYRNIINAITGNKKESKKDIDLLWHESRAIRDELKECKEKCCD